MKIIESNKRRVAISDYLTNHVGEIKRTATSFSENILKRHRHRLEVSRLLGLVYLFIPRLHPLKGATNRTGNSTFKQILNQAHYHAGNKNQKNTKIFKQQMQAIRQIIQRAFAGHEHSSDGKHLINKTSAEYKSVRTGWYLALDFRTSKIIFLSTRQFEMRRIPQPPDHLSKVFSATVKNLNAPKGAGKGSDPISPLRQDGGFVHRFIQNNFYRNGRISSIPVKRNRRIIPGHAKPILNRVKKNTNAGSVLESATTVFLEGSPKINHLKRKCKTFISVVKYETKNTGTMIPKKTQGLFIQRPIFKATISPVQKRKQTVQTGLFRSGFLSETEEHMRRTLWSVPENSTHEKQKIYKTPKKRISAEIREGLKNIYKPVFKNKEFSSGIGASKAGMNLPEEPDHPGGSNTPVQEHGNKDRPLEEKAGQGSFISNKISNRPGMKRRPGIVEKKILPAFNRTRSGLNSAHTTRTQYQFDQILIKSTRYPKISRIVKKQTRESRNTQIHEHVQLLTQTPASHFQIADSNSSATQTFPIIMNESLSLPVWQMRNQFNKNTKILSISSNPMNQIIKKAKKDRMTPSVSHQVKVLEPPGSFRESSLLYRSSRMENNHLPGKENPAVFKNKPIFAAAGSGASNSRKHPPELDHRAGESSSEQTPLFEQQKRAVREYLNSMPQQEVDLVADKVYDLIERRLSIEQERRGWA